MTVHEPQSSPEPLRSEIPAKELPQPDYSDSILLGQMFVPVFIAVGYMAIMLVLMGLPGVAPNVFPEEKYGAAGAFIRQVCFSYIPLVIWALLSIPAAVLIFYLFTKYKTGTSRLRFPLCLLICGMSMMMIFGDDVPGLISQHRADIAALEQGELLVFQGRLSEVKNSHFPGPSGASGGWVSYTLRYYDQDKTDGYSKYTSVYCPRSLGDALELYPFLGTQLKGAVPGKDPRVFRIEYLPNSRTVVSLQVLAQDYWEDWEG